MLLFSRTTLIRDPLIFFGPYVLFVGFYFGSWAYDIVNFIFKL
jgi:hypothetical protein